MDDIPGRQRLTAGELQFADSHDIRAARHVDAGGGRR
jgi:hypothetical protein